jgi:hypothetical protein
MLFVVIEWTLILVRHRAGVGMIGIPDAQITVGKHPFSAV